jgi:heme-degrading monooxygenase HmoA
MVLRFWSARTSESQSEAYLEHFHRSVLPKLRKMNGYIGATILRRRLNTEIEILVVTTWQSLGAIQEFAGPDIETAIVDGEAAALLKNFDRHVRHFDVASTDQAEHSPISASSQP